MLTKYFFNLFSVFLQKQMLLIYLPSVHNTTTPMTNVQSYCPCCLLSTATLLSAQHGVSSPKAGTKVSWGVCKHGRAHYTAVRYQRSLLFTTRHCWGESLGLLPMTGCPSCSVELSCQEIVIWTVLLTSWLYRQTVRRWAEVMPWYVIKPVSSVQIKMGGNCSGCSVSYIE